MKAWSAAALLLLASCDSGAPDPAVPEKNGSTPQAESAVPASDVAAAAAPPLPACPFRETQGWGGAIEGGRLVVNGAVDLQMAGFRPALTERSASGGTLALDLALAPEPTAPVTDRVRFERAGARGYRRGEIWCGGERLAEFDIVTID